MTDQPRSETAGAATGRAVRAALANRCPECGGGRLTSGFLQPVPECASCGADFRRHAAGDGAIFLVMLLLCVVVLGAAVAIEALAAPPLWVHGVVAALLTLALTIALLPAAKRFMIAQSYVMDARGDLGSDDARGPDADGRDR